LHRQAEHRKLAGDIAQTGHHVALAGDRHDGAWTPLANHAARELAPRRNEDRNLVAPRDLEHAVERLLRETAGDQHQQLALPHPATPPLRERVVDVDGRMLNPVALPEGARDQGRVIHQLQVGTALEQTLGQQAPAAIKGRRDHAQIKRLEHSEEAEDTPEDPGQQRPERAESWPDQIKKKGKGASRGGDGERREAEEQPRGRRKVATTG